MNLEFLEARFCLTTYTTVDLIPLAGHDLSVALGLNDNGMAVGYSSALGQNDQRGRRVVAGSLGRRFRVRLAWSWR